jgi:2-acylglycerol O-acyltransferase 2
MKHLRVAVPLFWGLCGSPVPKRTTLVVVVGAPIAVEKVSSENITREMVETTHLKFLNALKQMFDKHKETCGYPNAVLEVF